MSLVTTPVVAQSGSGREFSCTTQSGCCISVWATHGKLRVCTLSAIDGQKDVPLTSGFWVSQALCGDKALEIVISGSAQLRVAADARTVLRDDETEQEWDLTVEQGTVRIASTQPCVARMTRTGGTTRITIPTVTTLNANGQSAQGSCRLLGKRLSPVSVISSGASQQSRSSSQISGSSEAETAKPGSATTPSQQRNSSDDNTASSPSRSAMKGGRLNMSIQLPQSISAVPKAVSSFSTPTQLTRLGTPPALTPPVTSTNKANESLQSTTPTTAAAAPVTTPSRRIPTSVMVSPLASVRQDTQRRRSEQQQSSNSATSTGEPFAYRPMAGEERRVTASANKLTMNLAAGRELTLSADRAQVWLGSHDGRGTEEFPSGCKLTLSCPLTIRLLGNVRAHDHRVVLQSSEDPRLHQAGIGVSQCDVQLVAAIGMASVLMERKGRDVVLRPLRDVSIVMQSF
eukprot:TRINITY_DN8011_c0_g1_i2.p1 TRINITY_DN8011_c0_g1~~TRINITY_DN8011_c0_g1_i2.p1  ORF type:complete len:458 (+),score=86.29 TRINITY_DN8011_c0_g1_i2:262-1635(+)